MHGSIRYELRAKAQVSRAPDVETRVPVTVLWTAPAFSSEAVSVPLTEGESEILVAEVPNDVIEPSGRFSARVMMRADVKMRGIRVELIYRESVWPDGNNTTHETSLAQVFIPKEEMHYQSWQDVMLELPANLPIPFRSELIETSYHLKITIDIPLMSDKSVFIPLKLGKADDTQREIDELFESGEFIFKRRL
jgi:hypothetical protein